MHESKQTNNLIAIVRAIKAKGTRYKSGNISKDEGRKKLAEGIIEEFCSTVKPVEKVNKYLL